MPMTTLGWLALVVVWVLLAFWPARVAGRKGHSFFGYFIFSLFFFPAALIVAYMVQDRTASSADLATGTASAGRALARSPFGGQLTVDQVGGAGSRMRPAACAVSTASLREETSSLR